MNSNGDPDLSRLLRQWEVDAEIPQRFRASVWSQIAGRGPSMGERVSALFARPSFGAAVAAFALLASICLADVHADRVVEERRSLAQASYMASINPLVRVNPHGAVLTNSHGHE